MSQTVANPGRKRGKGRPFVKGQSGNPGGRLRGPHDVQQMARERTPDAIAALTAALSNPRERVAAAIALLDRGWGKPQQQILGDAEHPVAIAFSWAPAQQPNAVDTESNTPTIDANDAALKIVWDRDGTDGE